MLAQPDPVQSETRPVRSAQIWAPTRRPDQKARPQRRAAASSQSRPATEGRACFRPSSPGNRKQKPENRASGTTCGAQPIITQGRAAQLQLRPCTNCSQLAEHAHGAAVRLNFVNRTPPARPLGWARCIWRKGRSQQATTTTYEAKLNSPGIPDNFVPVLLG